MSALHSCEPNSVSEFYALAVERERMRRARAAGYPAPWTKDPILAGYRFCNVHRENDKTTIWFRENIRSKIHDPEKLVEATIGFRWFNRIETGERIKDVLVSCGWNNQAVRARLTGVSPVVTGAYMIKTPANKTKLEGILWCMEQLVWNDLQRVRYSPTLELAHAVLTELPYLGPFMAYEVVTDLRHTCVLTHASDILTWCSLGPGAARGLQWITRQQYNRNSPKGQAEMLAVCRDILAYSRDPDYWPQEWPAWEMREVEHWLCEYDKWKRGTNGQRLKRRYG